jgi:hypothetical protein
MIILIFFAFEHTRQPIPLLGRKLLPLWRFAPLTWDYDMAASVNTMLDEKATVQRLWFLDCNYSALAVSRWTDRRKKLG